MSLLLELCCDVSVEALEREDWLDWVFSVDLSVSSCVAFSWVCAFSFCWVLWIWFVLGCFVDVSLEDCCVCAVLPWLVGCTFIELFCSLE